MSPFSPFYPLLRSRTSLKSILVCGANTALQSAARGQTHLWQLWRSKRALPNAAGVGMPCSPLVLHFLFSHLPLAVHQKTPAPICLQVQGCHFGRSQPSHLTVSTAQHHHLRSSSGSALVQQGALQSRASRDGLHSTTCIVPGHKTYPLLTAETVRWPCPGSLDCPGLL